MYHDKRGGSHENPKLNGETASSILVLFPEQVSHYVLTPRQKTWKISESKVVLAKRTLDALFESPLMNVISVILKNCQLTR